MIRAHTSKTTACCSHQGEAFDHVQILPCPCFVNGWTEWTYINFRQKADCCLCRL